MQALHKIQDVDSTILCSFVIALYNRADTIERCLDSIVFQRTTHSFEIIIVDDQSTDSSLEVARVWQARYPNKIRVVQNPNKGVANAKNLGVATAKGMFVTFVDSDDYIDYYFLQTMIGSEGALTADMIIAPIWSIRNANKWRMKIVSDERSPLGQLNFLQASYFFLCGKLFRRSLFDKFGLLPNLRISEDTSWVFPAIAKTKNIVYVDIPGYFYELSANSISSSFNSKELVADAISSSEIILTNTPKEFRSAAEHYIMRRIIWYYLPKFKGFTKSFQEFLINRPELCVRWSAAHAVETPATCDKLASLIDDEISMMPTNVFVNGFGAKADVAKFQAVFESDTVLEVLDETNCCISSAPESVRNAYTANDWRFVAEYFAIQRIYERGGVYLDAAMDVLHPFWQMRETPAFFAYATEHSFTNKVFGGFAGQEVFRLLIRTYESNCFDSKMRLSERIRIVVTGITNLSNNAGIDVRSGYGVFLCPISQFVFSDGEMRKSALTIDSEAPIESIRAFDREMFCNQNSKCHTTSLMTSDQEKKLRSERDYYRKQVVSMETSIVWRLKERLKRPLMKIGVFSFLKRMGNVLLHLFK
jgi:glycosyltransferase involved in cell wall biosynthesis